MAEEFYAGDAICIEAEIRDSDDTLMTPDTSIQITVTDPDGTAKITSQNMTASSTGVYYYIWQSATTDTTGAYTVKVVAVDGYYTALVNHPSLFSLI